MEKHHLSVGFADLTDFRGLIDSQGLEAAVELLQGVFITAGDIIVRHQGSIHKYIGDKIMFTVADPRDAVIIAQDIAGSVMRSDARFKLRFHVSIATGEVVMVRIGHPSLMVDDILGQPVNTAYLGLREARYSPERYYLCPKTSQFMLKV